MHGLETYFELELTKIQSLCIYSCLHIWIMQQLHCSSHIFTVLSRINACFVNICMHGFLNIALHTICIKLLPTLFMLVETSDYQRWEVCLLESVDLHQLRMMLTLWYQDCIHVSNFVPIFIMTYCNLEA